ncbi:hypothetical protein [Sorangium sp. So ce131]|uniref:hypothetical protein n=1 Tax=Sorangium sp. So ce131 TaxID=3133282 RepID=UPI003F5DEAB0
MRLNVHIEQLVVEGLDMEGQEPHRLRAALQQELARLLASGGLEAGIPEARSLSSVTGPELRLGRDDGARRWGRQIAAAVYASLGSPAPEGAPPGRSDVVHDPSPEARDATSAQRTSPLQANSPSP